MLDRGQCVSHSGNGVIGCPNDAINARKGNETGGIVKNGVQSILGGSALLSLRFLGLFPRFWLLPSRTDGSSLLAQKSIRARLEGQFRITIELISLPKLLPYSLAATAEHPGAPNPPICAAVLEPNRRRRARTSPVRWRSRCHLGLRCCRRRHRGFTDYGIENLNELKEAPRAVRALAWPQQRSTRERPDTFMQTGIARAILTLAQTRWSTTDSFSKINREFLSH
jgi:hypothetical protein